MNYDNNPIVADNEYSYEQYKAFFMFSAFRGKHYKLGKRLFFFVFPLLIFLLNLIIIILSGFGSIPVFPNVVMILVYILFMLYVTLVPKILYKNSKTAMNATISISFKNEDMLILSTGALSSGTSLIKYEALFKVYETDTMFYIFIAPGQVFLINKFRLSMENCGKLRNLLSCKLGHKKYIICH